MTRSIRIGDLNGDPLTEMNSVFSQYRELLSSRRAKVAELNDGQKDGVELRTGWLLWQTSLREFLYFEEPTHIPNSEDYTAEWVESGGGSRKGSRNLWIYEKASGKKRYSVTTSAGAKIQPYFDVPPPSDPNIYHWTVIGESIRDGVVRVWLSRRTVSMLSDLVGSELTVDAVSDFVLGRASELTDTHASITPKGLDATAIMPVSILEDVYVRLTTALPSENDEHMFQELLERTGT
jgi:hypothetical protein